MADALHKKRPGGLCRALLGAVAMIVPLALGGTSADSTEAGFVVSRWYSEGGLPHNAIRQIVRDPRGFLWLGTHGGLARFDGRHFTTYQIPDEFTLGRYDIRSLAAEDEHTMLVLSGAGRLLRLRAGQFTPHPADAFLRDKVPIDIAIDATGALWIGEGTSTVTTTLMRWDGEQMTVFGRESGMTRRSSRYCIMSDAQKRTWIVSGNFAGWYEDGRLRAHEPLSGGSLAEIGALMATASRTGERLWIASRQNLSKLENGKWSVVVSGKNWSPAATGIQDIFETTDGTLWLSTRRNGVFRLAGDTMEAVSALDTRVESIAEDIDGNTWFGTNGGGLVRLKPKNYEILNSADGLPMDVSSSITEDENGVLWCANQGGGLVRIDGDDVTAIHIGEGNAGYVSNVRADKRGRLWIGTLNGLHYASTAQPAPKDGDWGITRHDAKIGSVQTLFCTGNGDLWVSWSGRQAGVLRADDNYKTLVATNGIPVTRFAGIVERQGADGPETWACLRRGQLFKLEKNDGERDCAFVEKPLPGAVRSGVQVFVTHVDPENRLWLGSSKGLLLWRDDIGGCVLYDRACGLPDDVIYQIITDDHGHLWASSRNGIFRAPIDQLLASSPEPGRQVTATLFGHDDNLEGLSGMAGGQPMTLKSRDGRLWFATYRGLVGFDPVATISTHKNPPVYIDELAVNGASIDIRANSEKHIRIAPGAMRVEFGFSALSFSAPERTQLRRMLEGFDLDWVDATGERSAVYSRLPPGKYTFRLEASDTGGVTQPARASLAIEIKPAWWQTKWFDGALVLCIVATVALIARRISNRILRQRLRRLERENALNRERARIARDLHDELGSRLSRISFVADRVYQQAEQPRQKEILERLQAQARNLVEDLHRVVWTINPKHDSWQHLATYISRYAQRQLSDTGIICTVDGVDAIPNQPVTPDIRNHLLAITKESLANMLKYSRATQVTIHLSADDERFHMSIADNGCGFDMDVAKQNEGNGLTNMRTRMKESDGQIEIKSAPGEGTRITINIALQRNESS